jgi:hypothetical protein
MNTKPNYLDNPEYRASSVKRLAMSFAQTLIEDLGEEEFQEVRARNATEKYAGCCASHDFCDANMVMWGCFNTEIGWDFDLDSETDVSVWNDAWKLARKEYLTAPETETTQ